MTRSIARAASAGVVFTLALGASGFAFAGTIAPCGADTCAVDFSIFVGSEFSAPDTGGAEFGGGQLIYNAESGAIALDTVNNVRGPASADGTGLRWQMPDGTEVRVSSLGGNADPILTFGLGATTLATGRSFAFSFDLPIAIDGPIDARSEVGYVLTAGSDAGAQVTAFGHVVEAFELDTTPGGLGALNKGVDVGDTFGFATGRATRFSPLYTASNSFSGDLAYDLMTVQVAFGLSADSSVGISGLVEQVPVPVPAAVWFLLSGAGALVALRRR